MGRDWRKFFSEYRITQITSDEDLLYQVGYTVNGRPIRNDQFQAMIEDIRQALGITGTDVCLDLCCGNGLLSFEIARYAKAVYGFDFSEPYIANALQHKKLPNIHYGVADVKRIGEILNQQKLLFSKALMYYSLAYFTVDDLGPLLQSLRSHALPGAQVLFGSIPDERRKFKYYNTLRRRLDYLWNVRCRGKESGIGNWWQQETIQKVSENFGFQCRILKQNPVLHTAHYRFDAVLTIACGAKA